MDDQRAGAMLRAARIRRGWRQVDLAARARVSDSTVSRIERGHAGSLPIDAVRGVAAALDVRVELLLRSRAGDLDRLVNLRHSLLADAVLARFAALPGWVARPEISFNVYGERGVVDVLAWHGVSRALLVIELKTEIVDVGELLGTLDRKRRLGPAIGRSVGWEPAVVGTWLLVAEGRTNRRRLVTHRATLHAALPDDGHAVRSWLHRPAAASAGPSVHATPASGPAVTPQRPAGALRAVSMWPDRHPGTARPRFATPRRVRRPPDGGA